ncbi:DinB family protein [Ulvibacter sp. MAR_2010_11]|uniref:DinB family protein n=1 Tax=Ulvibacter sp. MAR_2010_11 TaxID=1250229 RepID=UPI000C2BF813|nr:DinB family protein [Ulvibacter sp. MAR_2010_11]PKA83747.1 DinB family protein [Ulvibacter sp. MAR_2010_11]
MERQKWTEHKFNLGIHPGWTNNVMSRVRDTEIRLEHYCKNLTETQLIFQPMGAWSIKEHIGHLIDLEELHHNRIHEFAQLKPELSAADLSNKKTEAGNHNSKTLDSLLQNFRNARLAFINDFNALPEMSLQHNSLHPRLKVLMKPVDLLFFVAEHDDHHLASIAEIRQKL